jgi:hypothetical protein
MNPFKIREPLSPNPSPSKGLLKTMDNNEILEKALRKALNNGFSLDPRYPEDMFEFEIAGKRIIWYLELLKSPRQAVAESSVYGIIFDHDFAKSLWGEDRTDLPYGTAKIGLYRPLWQMHLQQMVIAEDPITYLSDHL